MPLVERQRLTRAMRWCADGGVLTENLPVGYPNVKRKIRNAACGVAQKFAVSAEHFAFLARESGNHEVYIDLLTGDISPSCFDIERNRIHVRRCVEFMKWRLDEIPGCNPASARLVVTFSKSDLPDWCFKSEFRVMITAHDGATWHGEFYTPGQMIAR